MERREMMHVLLCYCQRFVRVGWVLPESIVRSSIGHWLHRIKSMCSKKCEQIIQKQLEINRFYDQSKAVCLQIYMCTLRNKNKE